jgi:hypothetical protein
MRVSLIIVAGLLTLAAAACDSSPDSASAPTSTTSASTTTTTPPLPAPVTTRWHPLDKVRDPWPAALAAIRSSPTPAVAVERVLPILRAARQEPSERVTARVVDGDAPDEALMLIAWRGYADDSVSGSDIRIRATSGAGGVEILEREVRSICARGSGTDLIACV